MTLMLNANGDWNDDDRNDSDVNDKAENNHNHYGDDKNETKINVRNH